jgi:hypothetical protein
MSTSDSVVCLPLRPRKVLAGHKGRLPEGDTFRETPSVDGAWFAWACGAVDGEMQDRHERRGVAGRRVVAPGRVGYGCEGSGR